MALTPKDVSRIAHLARLELSPGEQAAMLTQLNGFFGIVERIANSFAGLIMPSSGNAARMLLRDVDNLRSFFADGISPARRKNSSSTSLMLNMGATHLT